MASVPVPAVAKSHCCGAATEHVSVQALATASNSMCDSKDYVRACAPVWRVTAGREGSACAPALLLQPVHATDQLHC